MKLEHSDEFKFLADYVVYPVETRKIIERFLITADAFADNNYRAVFQHFQDVKEPIASKLFPIMAKQLNLNTKDSTDRNELENEYADPVSSYIPITAYDVAKRHYCRQLREMVQRATNDCSDCADAETLRDRVKSAIDEIPLPPKLGDKTTEAALAEKRRKESEADIPDECLHVPGFIDKVVDYTLKAAHRPNRTLAFAGALALTAHLAGRRYKDPRNTRTNLYVFGLGPTGIGKSCPRDVNRMILRRVDPFLVGTVFDKVASGEAIETTLGKRPRALFQLDEFQEELKKMCDTRNSNGSSIVNYLLELYSESGRDHTMRVKATDPGSIGTYVYDPSLTLFATGIAKRTFQAFKDDLIEVGLLGRCLMFDSEIVSETNAFGDAGIPEMPSEIVEIAKRINNAAGGSSQDSPERSEPIVVNYDTGVGDYLDKIFKDIDRKRDDCRGNSDGPGEALWARANEKVCKLALVSAISRNPVGTLICQQDVTWAWKLVQVIVKRMLQRAADYAIRDEVDRIATEITDYLKKHGDECSQRDLLRSKRKAISDSAPNSDYQKAVSTLVKRGEIEVIDMGKGSIRFRLLDK